MATTEVSGLMRCKDAAGNVSILYPVTVKDNVDGMEEIDAHLINKENPHGVTADQIGAITSVNGNYPDENGNVEIVAGVQSDWSQLDETAMDYVKNRTHYEVEEIFYEPLNITWYGNTDGLTHIAPTIGNYGAVDLYKVSNCVLSDEQLKASDNSLAMPLAGTWDSLISNGQVVCTDNITCVCNGRFFRFILVAREDNAVYVDGTVIPEKGLYFGKNSNTAQFFLSTTESVAQYRTVLKTLDFKYLPESLHFGETGGETKTVVMEASGETSCRGTDKEIAQAIFDDYTCAEIDVLGKKYALVEFEGTNAESGVKKYKLDGDAYKTFSISLTDGIPNGDLGFSNDSYVNEVEVSALVVKPTITKIDSKFLPDGVGVRGNWSQNDETAYDYIENRTHWAKTTTILDNATLVDGYAEIDPIGSFNEGQTYRVVFDGVPYDCICVNWNGGTFLGNGAIESDDYNFGNNEPFLILGDPYYSEITASDTDSHTISIVEEVVHKLDKKFLPDTGGADWNAAEGEAGYVKNRTHWAVEREDTWMDMPNKSNNYFTLGYSCLDQLYEGKKLAIIINGEKYYGKLRRINSSSNELYIGNQSISSYGYDDINDSDAPFLIVFRNENTFFHTTIVADSYAWNIKEVYNEYHPLDMGYMPDELLDMVYSNSPPAYYRVEIESDGAIVVSDTNVEDFIAFEDYVLYGPQPLLVRVKDWRSGLLYEGMFVVVDTAAFMDDGVLKINFSYGSNPNNLETMTIVHEYEESPYIENWSGAGPS